MSAYTPKLAGSEPHKLAIDYAPKADMDLPAILRLKPAEPLVRSAHQAAPDSAMRIKLHAAPREAPVAVSATDAECRAYRKMLGAGASEEAWKRADPELLAQIPRLKETLCALDGEMSSALDKRLAVHARILELQSQQLTEVQKAVEMTAKQQKLHHKKHETEAYHARELEDRLRSVESVGQLHSKLHEATGKHVLEAKQTLRAVHKMQKTNEIRDDLHHEVGRHVERLHRQVETMQENHGLYDKLHEATTSKVLGLESKVGIVKRDVTGTRQSVQDLSATKDLQTKVHVEVAHNLKDLQQQMVAMRALNEQLSSPHNRVASDPVHGKTHKKIHQRATAEIATPARVQAAALSTQSFASAGASDVDVREMRSDIDKLVAVNAELVKKLSMQEQAVVSTSNIVRSLGQRVMGDAAQAAAAASVQKHDRVLSMFETDLASSNARGQNRRK